VTNSEAVKKEPLFSKDFAFVMTAGAGTAFMNHFFAVALALHVYAVGGLQMHAGIIAMAYAIAALAVRPISGMLSDKHGRVNQLIAGALICAITCFLYGITMLIPMLILIRAVQGIGFGMHSTCAGAVAADVLPKSRLSEGIGIFGLGATLAQAVGPGLAFFIIADGELSNFRLLFFIAAGMCAVSTVANSLISYERKRKKAALAAFKTKADKDNDISANIIRDTSGEVEQTQAAPKTFLGFERTLFPLLGVMILMFCGMTGLTLFLPIHTINTGIGNPSLYFLFSAAGVFLSRMLLGKVVDRRGADFVLIPGFLVIIAGYAILPLLTTLPMLVALGFPLGLAKGAVNPTLNAVLFSRCSPTRRGAASGAFFASVDIGFAIGSPLHGAILDIFDSRFVFWFGAILIALALVLYLLIASDKRFAAMQRREAA